MARAKSCGLFGFCLLFPVLLHGQVTVANHWQLCSGCGNTSFYHGDFNNDGYEDLAYIESVDRGGYPVFAVEFAKKDGTYLPATEYEVPLNQGDTDSIAQLAVGDFYHDGNLAILAFTYDSGNAYVYRNNGQGALTLQGSFAYAPSGGSVDSASAAVGDYNHDGNLDVAVVNNGYLHIWLGDGKGGFSAGQTQSVNGTTVAMGDFDGDGKADLLIGRDTSATGTAYVYYGDGAGHFPEEVTLSLPQGYAAFTAGDVNSDAKSDVLAVDPAAGANRVFVFYGDPQRQFASRTSIQAGRCVTGDAQVADMDGNGLNDVVVEELDCANPGTGPLWVDVLRRNPDSSYLPDQTVYWAQKSPDGEIHELSQPPLLLRANQDATPDLLVVQCFDSYCSQTANTTQLNTTSGNWPSCSAPWAAEGITVCSPLNGVSGSLVQFQIGAAGPVPMRDVEVWVDGSKVAEQIDGFSYYTWLRQSVNLGPGSHSVTVFAAGWDQSLVRKSFTLDVQ
ncbi:MAG TPA: FG-GAP-like repeat-containing protein [Acidobacteriaceae bacterium]|nr:FG-GAP-like repeat-containing protein [Acidobacteriaceae bacterium]